MIYLSLGSYYSRRACLRKHYCNHFANNKDERADTSRRHLASLVARTYFIELVVYSLPLHSQALARPVWSDSVSEVLFSMLLVLAVQGLVIQTFRDETEPKGIVSCLQFTRCFSFEDGLRIR